MESGVITANWLPDGRVAGLRYAPTCISHRPPIIGPSPIYCRLPPTTTLSTARGAKRRPAGQAWIVIGYLLPDTFPIPKTIIVDICRPQLRLCFRETVRVRVMNIVAEVKSYRFGVRFRLLRSESLNKVGEKK